MLSSINFPDKIYKGVMNWSRGDDAYMTIQTVSNPWKIVPRLMLNRADNKKYLTIDVECLYELESRYTTWEMEAETEIIVQSKNANVAKTFHHKFMDGIRSRNLGAFMKVQDFASTKLESGFQLKIHTNLRICSDVDVYSCEFSILQNIHSEIVCRLGEHILYLDKYPLICFSTQFREMLSRSDVLDLPLTEFKYADYVGFFRLLYGQKQEITENNCVGITHIAWEFGVECILSDCEDFLITSKDVCIQKKLSISARFRLAKIQAKIVENLTIKEINEVIGDPLTNFETVEILKIKEEIDEEPSISERLATLEELLSNCLVRLGKLSENHKLRNRVLALQPEIKAFFLFHEPQKVKKDEAKEVREKSRKRKKKGSKAQQPGAVMATSSVDALQGTSSRHENDADMVKLVKFAEEHRQVLNQAVFSGLHSVLARFPKLLRFDLKRKFFRKELSGSESHDFRRNNVSIQVHRNSVFSDSCRELLKLSPEVWKSGFSIVFDGDEGQHGGDHLGEWFSLIAREIFNPIYALFITARGNKSTHIINKDSSINPEHLDYFKFVGRFIAKSVYEHRYLDCYFTRALYKHILNLPVRYQDLESEDPAFFAWFEFSLKYPIDDLGINMTFSEVEEFGARSVRDLKSNGRRIQLTDANKDEYITLTCHMKMTGSIRQQLDAFLQGFYEIIPKDLIEMFSEQELELMISGLPTVDIDDLAANTDYYEGYQKTSVQIQWFWRALKSFEKEDKAKFLQFVTGTSKVPLQGFSSLEGMNGTQKFSIHMDSRRGDRLPAAHTCFNELDLPQYESFEKLRDSLLLAIRACTERLGFNSLS